MILHTHNGIDSPKIKTENIDGELTTGDDEMHLTGDENVAGIKTLSSIPILPTSNPTAASQIARKAYADSLTQPGYTLVASDELIDQATADETTTNQTPIIKKDILYNEANATIRVSFQLKSPDNDNSARGRIYINDVAVGTEQSTNQPDWQTYTEDIAVETGDHIQLYLWRQEPATIAECQNLKLFYTKQLAVTVGTVVQD